MIIILLYYYAEWFEDIKWEYTISTSSYGIFFDFNRCNSTISDRERQFNLISDSIGDFQQSDLKTKLG